MKQQGLTGEIVKLIDKRLVNSTRLTNKRINKSISTFVSDDVNLINFWENGLIKMAIGVVADKDNIQTPMLALGAGDGLGNNRGYITKGTDGLEMYYIGDASLGEVAGFKLKKNGIFSTHSITIDSGLATEFLVDATNWNKKLEEATTKAILENGAKNWDIPAANLDSGVNTSLGYANANNTLLNTTRLNGDYIQSAAISASKVNLDQVMLTDLLVQNNSPSAGYIRWTTSGSSIKLYYNGITYNISSNSTYQKYIYWTVGESFFSSSDTRPTESSSLIMIFINNAGINSKAYYSRVANKYIGSAFIDDLAVNNAHIANATITSAKIASLAADKISTGILSTSTFTDVGYGTGYQLLNKQIHQFVESGGLVKMAIGFAKDSNGVSTIPGLVLGAGSGDESGVNKGYINKDANGLNLFYVSSVNTAQGISIKSDGIYCTSELKLDTTLSQTYVTQAGWLSNLTQKLNSSGNFGVNQSSARTEITDRIIVKNSSGQQHGLVLDPTYSDLWLYYNGVEHFKIYNELNGNTSLKLQGNRIGYGSTTKFYPTGSWDFTDTTLIGTKKIVAQATAPSDTSVIWLDIS